MATGGWARLTPTADCCCASSTCPTSGYAVPVLDRGHRGGGDPGARHLVTRRDQGRPVELRIFGPDDTESSGASAGTGDEQAFEGRSCPRTTTAPDGRVMGLQRAQCEGWLEGYLLIGRHGLFDCYEAFIHIVDSMFDQHASRSRSPTASAGGADRFAEPSLSSLVWRQDHNGCSRQDPAHRPRGEQEGAGRPGLPSAARQHAPVRRRPLPALPAIRQRHRGRQAAGTPMAVHGRRDHPLHQ